MIEGIAVTAVVEDGDAADGQCLLQCSECGPLAVVSRHTVDQAAIEHLRSHGVPIPPEV